MVRAITGFDSLEKLELRPNALPAEDEVSELQAAA